MNTRSLVNLLTASGRWRWFAIQAFSFFALTSGALAQQSDVAQLHDAATSAVAKSTGCGGPEPCMQNHPPLPNAPSTIHSAASSGDSLTFGERAAIYRQAILRPYSIVGPGLGAGIGQWENEPPEWGQGGKGYARRLASGMGRNLISETIRFGLAAADGEDPRYHPSQDTGVWNRARHAIVETFTSQTSSGARIPAYSRFAGAYGAAFISNAWYPDSRATPGYALRRGSTALGSSLGFHLFEEFIPRKYFKALDIQN